MYSVKVKLCIKGADKKYCPCLPPACLPGPCLVMPRCLPVRPLPCKVPVQARSRSDKCAAVLRLQRTQPKDRRIYTAFTGILAGQRPHREDSGASPGTGQGDTQAEGRGNIFYLHPLHKAYKLITISCFFLLDKTGNIAIANEIKQM